jgi:hypothetical protein
MGMGAIVAIVTRSIAMEIDLTAIEMEWSCVPTLRSCTDRMGKLKLKLGNGVQKTFP